MLLLYKKVVFAQRGARTHDPEIKSLMLYRLSQPGLALTAEIYILIPHAQFHDIPYTRRKIISDFYFELSSFFIIISNILLLLFYINTLTGCQRCSSMCLPGRNDTSSISLSDITVKSTNHALDMQSKITRFYGAQLKRYYTKMFS